MGAEPPSDSTSLEADILAVALGRDRDAFTRLFRHYAPRVKAYLRRTGAAEPQAEDLAQEVMVVVWQRAAQFDPTKAGLGTWIYTIARNRWIDALRRERRPEHEPGEPPSEIDPSPRADEVTEMRQVEREVERAIRALPAEQAQLLRIFYFEDKTHSVIAEELGLPLGTVKSRLRLALGKMRGLLGDLA
jgi:RNA polymerase sigma-70 factor (ECF subfamily)